MQSRLAVVVISENARHRLPVFLLNLAYRVQEAEIEDPSITVIDNGSRDGSDEIVSAIGKTLKWLKLVRFESPLSETDLLVRGLSEIEPDHLLFFFGSGVSPENINSYLHEAGGDQFVSFLGELPRFEIQRPERWFGLAVMKLAEIIHPKSVLSLRSFGILVDRNMGEALVKELAVGGASLRALQRSLMRLGGVSKTHVLAGGPVMAFPLPGWRILFEALKARVLRLGRS